ncbi:MAG: ATP-binding protein [Candidatus Obscuribacter phosphatis]|uniref:ATP-binding protein n=1 Tax=Candidatus Obscuribacter phosphatis TaxID=1906157 RepID=A0A8J7PAB2_9BACT|nr:ATP-binding protein [Candidatus Obscuribacter phosphatis]
MPSNKEAKHNRPLGMITQGSLSAGLEMRLDGKQSVENLRVGRFVVIEGENNRFFSMLTDVSLSSSNASVMLNPPANDAFLMSVLSGTTTFGTVKLQPMLMLTKDQEERELRPVKTIPSHFSPVYEADAQDFALVFGDENEPGQAFFNIGQPLNMDVPVCINLNRFIERSNGIFGKSGTGKSFLNRILLSGVIAKDLASVLIFDMHNEYGWQAMSENKSAPRVKGLKQLFGANVVVFSLDAESSKARGIPDARELYIGYNQIEIEDLDLLKNELALSEATLENAYIARERLGQDWISTLLDMTGEEIEEFTVSFKGHPTALKTLQRRLNTVVQKTPYLRPRVSHNYIEEILSQIKAGKNVVLEFGRQNNLLSYMLATNIITRRIHADYVRQSERHICDPENVRAPRKLMIVIEEAHKFLAPQVARQTIFGIIAREMRKYFVTLLIVDQRPSGIDPEILSQIGTRVTALLNDDKDIDAVFTGVSGSQTLRTVLAQMDPKQQALVLGYAVPMPVVVRTRSFDTDFYKAVAASQYGDSLNADWRELASGSPDEKRKLQEKAEQAISELFPDD